MSARRCAHNAAWTDWAARAERAARDLRSAPATDAHIRVSDAERNAVADQLSTHFGAGRLDQTEFEDRMNSAMTAKTRAELPPLLADLPPLSPPTQPPHRRPGHRLPALALLLLAALTLGTAWNATAPHLHLRWLPVLILALLVIQLRRRRHHG